MTDLPLRAAYTVTELARATGIERRRLQRALEDAGVRFLQAGRVRLVSLSEIERKVPLLWEGIKAAYAIGGENP
ncbi:MAG: hypothetical protein ACLQVI_32170 [Polyangiaceae bacterium]